MKRKAMLLMLLFLINRCAVPDALQILAFLVWFGGGGQLEPPSRSRERRRLPPRLYCQRSRTVPEVLS